MRAPQPLPHVQFFSDYTLSSRQRTVVGRAVVISIVLVATCVVVNRGNVGGTSQTNAKRAQNLQIIHGPAVTFMGSDTLNKGYNFLRGAGADPRTARAIGQFTISAQKTLEYGGTVYYQPDQVDLTMNVGCQSNSGSRSVQRTYSVSSVAASASASSESYSARAEVSYGGKSGFMKFLTGNSGMSLTVGGGMALMRGRSEASMNSRSFASHGYSSSSESFVASTLFNAYVDWAAEHSGNGGSRLDFQYENEFLKDASSLNGMAPGVEAEKAVFKIIERWGTHVISEATYGMRCSSTMYIQGSATTQETHAMAREAGSERVEWDAYMEASYKVVSGSASTTGSKSSSFDRTSSTSGTFAQKLKYQISNVRCEGYIKDNLCDGRFSGAEDAPVMIEYTPMEIWKVKRVVGNSSVGVFNGVGVGHFRDTLGLIGQSFKSCRDTQCGGGGYCVLSNGFWKTVRDDANFNPRDLSQAWDASICICDNGPAIGEGKLKCRGNMFESEELSSRYQRLAQPFRVLFDSPPSDSIGLATVKHGPNGRNDAVVNVVFDRLSPRITFSCQAPKIALATALIGIKSYPDLSYAGYHGIPFFLISAIQQDSVTSKQFGLHIQSEVAFKYEALTMAVFATCDPRIEVGTRGEPLGNRQTPISKTCSADQGNLHVWFGFRHAWGRADSKTISSGFDTTQKTLVAFVTNFYNGSRTFDLACTQDYVAWCDKEVPSKVIQEGWITAVNQQTHLWVIFKTPLGCQANNIQVIVSLTHVLAEDQGMAVKPYLYAYGVDINIYGFKVVYEVQNGFKFKEAQVNWIATCI